MTLGILPLVQNADDVQALAMIQKADHVRTTWILLEIGQDQCCAAMPGACRQAFKSRYEETDIMVGLLL